MILFSPASLVHITSLFRVEGEIASLQAILLLHHPVNDADLDYLKIKADEIAQWVKAPAASLMA